MVYPAGEGLLLRGEAVRTKSSTRIGNTKAEHQGLSKVFNPYCSQKTHTWIQKSADSSDLGTDSIRWIKQISINQNRREKTIGDKKRWFFGKSRDLQSIQKVNSSTKGKVKKNCSLHFQ